MELATKTLYSRATISESRYGGPTEEASVEILFHYSNQDPLVVKVLMRLDSGEVKKEYISRDSLFSAIESPGRIITDGVRSFYSAKGMLCISRVGPGGISRILVSGNVVKRVRDRITERTPSELIAFNKILDKDITEWFRLA